MDIQALNKILKIASILSIIPSKESRKLSFIQKCTTTMFLMVWLLFEIYSKTKRLNFYVKEFSFTQIIFQLVSDIALFTHTYYSLVVLTIIKRRKFILLLHFLEQLLTNHIKNIYFSVFYFINIIYFILQLIFVYFFIVSYSRLFFAIYFLQILQFSLFRFYLIICYNILILILGGYHYQTQLFRMHCNLTNNCSIKFSIKKFSKSLYILKKVTEMFNQSFGWTLLLYIFYGASKTLNAFDHYIKGWKNSFQNPDIDFFLLLDRFGSITFIFVFWVKDSYMWCKKKTTIVLLKCIKIC